MLGWLYYLLGITHNIEIVGKILFESLEKGSFLLSLALWVGTVTASVSVWGGTKRTVFSNAKRNSTANTITSSQPADAEAYVEMLKNGDFSVSDSESQVAEGWSFEKDAQGPLALVNDKIEKGKQKLIISVGLKDAQ